jgi:HEAT repeat protein
MHDPRARFFLEQHLNESEAAIAQQAAVALAQIGEQALLPLKAALRSDRRESREAAAQGLLAVATPDDVSILFEYLTDHPKDDPATLRAVREVASTLERLRQAREAAGAATPPPTD